MRRLTSSRIILRTIFSLVIVTGVAIPSQKSIAEEERVAVELEQVDIKDFVRWCAQLIDQTIIIHPQVSGSVTVISGKEISKAEAYQVFLATLQVYGYTVIRSDGVLKVIPSEQAASNEIPLLSDDSTTGSENIVVKI